MGGGRWTYTKNLSFENVKMQKKVGRGDGCVQRIEVILKMPKRKSGGGGGVYGRCGGSGVGVVYDRGGQAGCVLRIEVIVKMQKKSRGGGGVRSGDRVARLGVVGDMGYGGVNQE